MSTPRHCRSRQRLRGVEVETHYDVKEQLGKGNYAVVYRGVCKETGEDFALKRINKASNGIDDIDKEIDIMLEVVHPFVYHYTKSSIHIERSSWSWKSAPGGSSSSVF